MFVTVLDLDHRSNGDVLCCTQFRCHLSEQPVVQNAAFAHISAECSFFSSVFENGSKPNLHCCCIALGCIALSFFMTLKTDSKDLWSLRHWWTLVCLWSICYGDFWKFRKFILAIVLMIYACDHLYNWFEGCFILVIIIMPHLYDHYNASFEGCFIKEPDHTTEYLVKRDCPATANILTLSNWSSNSLLRFCRKSSDFWRFLKSFQTFGQFSDFWKITGLLKWPGTWHWLGCKGIIRVPYDPDNYFFLWKFNSYSQKWRCFVWKN